MSIAVGLDELAATLAERPWGYLITVTDDQRTRILSVPTQLTDGVLTMSAGRGACANAAARPDVTMVFPPASGTDLTLIVDGRARVVGDRIEVAPTAAVLHRPAL
jgi:hypothetical protein